MLMLICPIMLMLIFFGMFYYTLPPKTLAYFFARPYNHIIHITLLIAVIIIVNSKISLHASHTNGSDNQNQDKWGILLNKTFQISISVFA